MIEFTDSPLEPLGQVLLDMSIETDLSLKTAMVYRVIRLLREQGHIPSYGTNMAELTLEEVLANAMVHGNKLDRNKPVHIVVFGNEKQWGLIIEDQGDGFSPEQLPNVRDPENLLAERGRGVHLISLYMDDVRYNRRGNRVRLLRTRQAEPDAGAVAPVAPRPQGEPLPARVDLSEFEKPTDHLITKLCNTKPAVPVVALPDEIDLALPAGVGKAGDSGGLGPLILTRQGDVTIVKINADRMTEDNAADLRSALMNVLQPGKPLIVDLSAVTFISSIGIGILSSFYRKAKAEKTPLSLISLGPALQQVFKVTGLLRVLPIDADMTAALKRVGAVS